MCTRAPTGSIIGTDGILSEIVDKCYTPIKTDMATVPQGRPSIGAGRRSATTIVRPGGEARGIWSHASSLTSRIPRELHRPHRRTPVRTHRAASAPGPPPATYLPGTPIPTPVLLGRRSRPARTHSTPATRGGDNRMEKHARCRPRTEERGICEPRRPYTISRSKSGHLLDLRSSEKKGGAGMGGTRLGSSPADPAGTYAWLVADRDLSEVDPRGLPSRIRRIRILAPDVAISFASSCAQDLEAVCVGRLSWVIDYNGSTGSGASSRHRRGLNESLRRSHHG